MTVEVRIRLNEGRIRRLLSTRGQVGRRVEEVTARVANQARMNAPVVTGRLRASIRSEVVEERGKLVGRVWTDAPYAGWVHNGRGPVRPVRAKALRFTVNGRVVFTRYAGPARAQPFLWDALRQQSPWPARRR